MVSPTPPSSDNLKESPKEALLEVIHERRDFFLDLVAELMEDVSLSESIQEGLDSVDASAEDVIEAIDADA